MNVLKNNLSIKKRIYRFSNSRFWHSHFCILNIVRLQINLKKRGFFYEKYIIMALLPIIFQGALYSADSNADLNKAIKSELISAKRVMNNVNIPLELNLIVPVLLSYVERKRISRMVAIDQIKAIKNALEKSKWF